eukprot:106033-Rhodomonas_salina.1
MSGTVSHGDAPRKSCARRGSVSSPQPPCTREANSIGVVPTFQRCISIFPQTPSARQCEVASHWSLR